MNVDMVEGDIWPSLFAESIGWPISRTLADGMHTGDVVPGACRVTGMERSYGTAWASIVDDNISYPFKTAGRTNGRALCNVGRV
jgi:hypothetical protein